MTGHASGSSPGKEGLQEVLVARILPLLDVEQAKTIFDGSIHFKNIINPIADYLTVSAPNGVPSVYGNSTPVAQECVLHWCTKRLSVSNYQGKVTLEQVGAPTIQTGKAPFPWSLGHPMGERPNVIFNANFTFKPPNQPLAFSVSNDTMFQTVTCLQDFLPSFLTGYNGRSTMPFRFANFDGAPYVKDMTFNPLADIAALNDRVGLMMTKVLLTVANGTNRLGSSWENVVYYHVRWAWMSLPIVLLLFSLTFLLATIFRSKEEQDIGIRKNSALAALLNGLTDNVRGEVGLASSSSTGDACIKAKHVRVKLLLNKENQYRLSDKTELSWTASYDLQQG